MADFGVIVGLDVTKSVEEIKNDITGKLKPKLDSDTSARLTLIAQLDPTKTLDTIKTQLGDITKSLSGAKINLGIDSATMQSDIKTTVAKAAENANKTAVIKPTVDINPIDEAFKLLKQKYLEVSGVNASSSPFKALETVIQKVSERIKGLEIKPDGISHLSMLFQEFKIRRV